MRRAIACALGGLLLAAAGPALAGEECTLVPIMREVARGVYVQDARLVCRETPLAERVRDAREIFGLCRDLGGTPEACRQALLERADPAQRALLEAILRSAAAGDASPL